MKYVIRYLGEYMIIKFMRGKRNRYKFLFGFYVKRVKKRMGTINFRWKRNVYTIFINFNKID